jgi:hypothetical protein
MAITIPNSSVETFSATEQATHTINLPTYSAGDVIEIVINHSPDGTATIGDISSAPTGFTELGTRTPTGAASNSLLSRWYRVMNGTEGSTVSVTTDTSMTMGAIARVMRGVDTSNPVDVTVPSFNTGTGPPVCPSITPATVGALISHAAIQDGTTGAIVDADIPSGDTLDGTMNNNPPSNGMNLGLSYFIASDTNPTGTATYQNSTTEEHVGSTVAFRPSAASYEETHHRIYEDGDPDSSTPLANEDADADITDAIFQARMQTEATGNPPNQGRRIQVDWSGDNDWRDVPT